MRLSYLFAMVLWLGGHSFYCKAQENRKTLTIPDGDFIKSYISTTEKIDKVYADSIINRYKHAFMLSVSIGYHEASAYCLGKIADFYFNDKKDYIRSQQYLYYTLPYLKTLQKKDYWLIPGVYNLLGAVHSQTGHNDSAMYYYHLTLRTIDSLALDQPRLRSMAYANMGAALTASKQYDKAIAYINISQSIIKENKQLIRNDSVRSAVNYANLGSLYANGMKNMDSATYWFSLSINLYRHLAMRSQLQDVYSNIATGWLSITHQDISKAEHYLDTAVRTDPQGAQDNISIQLNLAALSYHRGSYFNAIVHSEKALSLCEASGIRERKRSAYSILSYSYAYLGDRPRSDTYQRQFELLSDSLLNEEITRSISQVEIQYRIAEKDKVLAKNEAALYRQRNWLIGSTGGGLLLLLFLLGFIRNSRQKRRLHGEQLQNLQQRQKIEHLQVKMEAEEQERKRIARELHDGLGVLLSAAKINHNVLGKTFPVQSAKAAAYQQNEEILQQMQQEIKTIANNLIPDYITHESFEEALASLANRFNDSGAFSIALYTYGQVTDLHPERSFALYRTIEEIINNAVKHSGGTTLLIQLIYHHSQLHITIEDNGEGFDTQKLYAGRGLQNIKSRVEMLKGHVNISSDKENGTTYTLEIPYS